MMKIVKIMIIKIIIIIIIIIIGFASFFWDRRLLPGKWIKRQIENVKYA